MVIVAVRCTLKWLFMSTTQIWEVEQQKQQPMMTMTLTAIQMTPCSARVARWTKIQSHQPMMSGSSTKHVTFILVAVACFGPSGDVKLRCLIWKRNKSHFTCRRFMKIWHSSRWRSSKRVSTKVNAHSYKNLKIKRRIAVRWCTIRES